MNNIDRESELKHQIARLEQELRHEQERRQLAYQQSLKHDQLGNTKLLARSQSIAGYAVATPSMSQASPDDRAPKRQKRAMSQQASQHMSRSASHRSEVAGPFRHTGAVLQPLAAPTRPLPNIQLDPQSQSALAMPDVGVRPDEFLAGLSPDASYLPMTGAHLSPLDLSNPVPVSKCPSLVSGYSAGDGLTPMTRQNSFFGDNTTASIDMSRWMSSSQSSRDFEDPTFSSQVFQAKYQLQEHDFIGVGANLPTDMTRSYSSSMQSQGLLLSPPDSAVEPALMERSESNDSTISVKSTASAKRSKEALARQIKAGMVTILAPKPQQAGEQKPKAVAPVKKEGKIPVPKHTYQRRKPVKVYCDQCNDHPDGFRGDHELRRHHQSKHEVLVKKFVCRDPATVGIATNLKVVKPLADCKACRAGKPYGAYYNAAAHLRRQHFKPRQSRSKGRSEEKRGGHGGGNWPPMDELKDWFEERRMSANSADDADAVQGDVDPEIDDGDMDYMESYSLDTAASYSLGQLTGDEMLPLGASDSPVDTSFDLNQLVDVSPVQVMMTGFMDDGSQIYGSPFSANTVTPSNLQDIGQLPLGDGPWSMQPL